MTSTKRFPALAICRMAILVAMYCLLDMVSIKAPFFEVTFQSLPVVVSALLMGPLEAALVGLLGEFMGQLLGPYGLTPTTVLWIIPPVARALVIGLTARVLARTGRPLECRPVLCYVVSVLGAAATTACNTAALCVDSMIYGYVSIPVILAATGTRLTSGAVTAVVLATVAIPLVRLLRRRGLSGLN